MGRQMYTVTASSLKCNVWQQPGGNALASEVVNPEGFPSDRAQVALLTTTDLANPQALASTRSDGSTIATEEESTYDMCTIYTDTQDDDYVLVALEPAPRPLSENPDKGQGTPNK